MKKLTIVILIITGDISQSYCSQTSADVCREATVSLHGSHEICPQRVTTPSKAPRSYQKIVPHIKKRSFKKSFNDHYNYMMLMAGIFYLDARDYWREKVKQLKKFGRSLHKHA